MNRVFSNRTNATRFEREAETAAKHPHLQALAGAITPASARSGVDHLGRAVSHYLKASSSEHVPRSRDIGDLKLHNDNTASSVADMFKANAVTIDNHIYFGRNQFRPGDRRGQELIVHEVAHGVQERPRDSAHRSGPDDLLLTPLTTKEREFIDYIMDGQFDKCNDILRDADLATKLALLDTITKARSVVPSPAWVNLNQAELLIQAWIDDPGQFSPGPKPTKAKSKPKSKPKPAQTQTPVDGSPSFFTQSPDTPPPTYLERSLQTVEDIREAERNIAENADNPKVARAYEDQLFQLRKQEQILQQLMEVEVRQAEVRAEIKEVESKIEELKKKVDSFDEGYSTRKECLLAGGGVCQVAVAPNPGANAAAPRYEFHGQYPHEHSAEAAAAARKHGLDPDLVKAIMYMETTHGYYDKIIPFDLQKSVLPMNINDKYWGEAFGTREQLNDPVYNIDVGADMLARIVRMLPADASIEQIATLYNNINARKVSDYGARVAKIYKDKLWVDGG